MTDLAQAVRHLRGLTEEQIAAARALDVTALNRLNEARLDALFALRVAAADAPATPDPALADEVRGLAHAQTRLAAITRTVLATVDRVGTARAPTLYGRSGRLGA